MYVIIIIIIIILLLLHYMHYINVIQTPLTAKVTSGCINNTCYTKYSPPAQHAG